MHNKTYYPYNNCRGLIPRVHPQILLCVCPRGILPTRPRVTSFITVRTTFKVPESILSRLFELPSSHHLLHSLKSILICETLPNWHQIDWWDSSHPYVCFSRCKVGGAANCIITHSLTQPSTALQMWWLPCHYCTIFITRANLALLSFSSPRNIIKTLL